MKLYGPSKTGNYSCWDPLNKRTVSLGSDESAARVKHAEILTRAGRGTSGARSEETQLPGEASGEGLTRPPPPIAPRVDAQTLLGGWLLQPGASVGGAVTTDGRGQPPSGNPGSTPGMPATPAATVRPPKKGAITPEQAAKIGGGLKRIVTKANVVLDGALISMFGRKPAMPEDDELEMLALGWEMMIEEFFVKNTPKPWMLVAAGNVLMMSAMYLQGTPIPKKTKADREAEKNAQQSGMVSA